MLVHHPNITLNLDYGIFYLRFINAIQGTKPSGQKCNILLDVLVTILNYKKITIYNAIYVNFFYYGTVSTDDVLKNNNNDTAFPELTIFLEEHFDVKVQEGYVLKYLNLRIFQSPLGFSVDQTDHILILVNGWFPTGKFIKVNTPFRADSKYEN